MTIELEARWQLFYQKSLGSEPHPTLVKALEHLQAPLEDKFAIDLGVGSGRDTLFLLKKGCSTLAVDKNKIAFGYLLKAAQQDNLLKKLKTLSSSFEELDISDYPQADLINASYSLPFCQPEFFSSLWQKIFSHLKTGGVFCGHFFGHRHSWSENKSMSFHGRDQILPLFSMFDMLYFEEEDWDGVDIQNNPVHWHVFISLRGN